MKINWKKLIISIIIMSVLWSFGLIYQLYINSEGFFQLNFITPISAIMMIFWIVIIYILLDYKMVLSLKKKK